MRTLFDTSVLVAAVVLKHDAHARAYVALARVQDDTEEGFVSAHSLAEMYAVLTRLPVPFRHTPAQAWLSIEENVLKHFRVTALTQGGYSVLIREAALTGIEGGAIYDALLLKCAAKSEVDTVCTLNLKHFQALAPKSPRMRLAAP
ncbi:MAG: PIN domain-containing protein [Limisphaerales bacterium]